MISIGTPGEWARSNSERFVGETVSVCVLEVSSVTPGEALQAAVD